MLTASIGFLVQLSRLCGLSIDTVEPLLHPVSFVHISDHFRIFDLGFLPDKMYPCVTGQKRSLRIKFNSSNFSLLTFSEVTIFHWHIFSFIVCFMRLCCIAAST